MQSTRIWLADTIGEERELAWAGMAAWLRADPQLTRWRMLDERTLRRVCLAVLRHLGSWLRHGEDANVLGAATILRTRRATDLAASFVVEFLKQRGHMDLLKPRERTHVRDLVAGFFSAIGPRLADGIVREGA